MGILTDYFAATPDEALACVDDGPLGTDLPKAELKWVEPAIILGSLWAAVDGAKYSVDVYSGDDEMVASLDEQGPWVIRIKEACRAAVAGVRDDQIPSLAAVWSQAEEWHGADPSDLAEIIPELRTVARQAGQPGRALYVWISL